MLAPGGMKFIIIISFLQVLSSHYKEYGVLDDQAIYIILEAVLCSSDLLCITHNSTTCSRVGFLFLLRIIMLPIRFGNLKRLRRHYLVLLTHSAYLV